MVVDPAMEALQIERLKAWRAERDDKAVKAAIADLERAAKEGRNIMEPSIVAARVGVTTGEWGGTLRRVFGEYRAPTGVAQSAVARDSAALDSVRASVDELSAKLGRRVKFLVGKPGLDGHSNGAEQIAVRARDVGMDVVYEGIRLTPAQIVRAAVDESTHVIGLSILSGSHVPLVQEVMERLRKEGLDGRARRRRRHHSARGRSEAEGVRRRRRVHAEELPAQRHHERHRASRRQPGDGRLDGANQQGRNDDA